MKKLIFTTFAAASLISGQTFALNINSSTDSKVMHIQVSNETSTKCTLKDFIVHHGAYEEYPPASILPGDSKSLDIHSFGYGPSIELTYDCNGKKVTLYNQMDLSILFSKMPTAKVLRKDDGLTVTHNEISGSWWRHQPGVVNWVMSESK